VTVRVYFIDIAGWHRGCRKADNANSEANFDLDSLAHVAADKTVDLPRGRPFGETSMSFTNRRLVLSRRTPSAWRLGRLTV
jgi:hypothetical protein